MYYLMAISSIVNKQKSSSNILLYIFGIAGVGLVVYFGGYIISHFGDLKAKSGINIEVLNSQADVYINDKYVGNTPFTSGTVSSGTNKVTLKSGFAQIFWTGIRHLSIRYFGVIRRNPTAYRVRNLNFYPTCLLLKYCISFSCVDSCYFCS